MRVMLAIAMLAAAPAVAQDKAAPAAVQERLFDPTKPPEVAEALREAGYKAILKTNDKGEPLIESAVSGSPFTIEFYGCRGVTDCGSFQFYGWYKKEPIFTHALVNEWNVSKRILKVAIDKDGDLGTWMDVAGVGKITQAAFADWVDWYSTMDGDLSKFLEEKRVAAKATK